MEARHEVGSLVPPKSQMRKNTEISMCINIHVFRKHTEIHIHGGGLGY